MTALRMPRLFGNGIVLREWRRSDLPAVAEASTDKYIVATTSIPATFTEDEGLAWLQRQHDHVARGSAYPFAISRDFESEALGFVGLSPNRVRCWEAGYWVVPSARGQGIAGAAVQLASEWALAGDDVTCIELRIEPWNIGSQRIAERAGYVLKDERSGVEYRGYKRDFLVYVQYSGGQNG